MLPLIADLKRTALDFFFPRFCVGCGRQGDFFCPSCRQSLQPVSPPLCPRCGRPQAGGVLCSACVAWPAKIDAIRSPFRFEGAIRQAVHQLKYRNLRALAEPMAGLLAEYWNANQLASEILVPVPLHPKRWKERGYNQSGLLAHRLGRLIGLPVDDEGLVRQRHTVPQARTTAVAERKRNIAGAFTCRDERFRGKEVLLIDDVATSGATLDACAAALKNSGAAAVWGLVIAREI